MTDEQYFYGYEATVNQNGKAVLHDKEFCVPRDSGADLVAAMHRFFHEIASAIIEFSTEMWYLDRPLAIRYPHRVRYD